MSWAYMNINVVLAARIGIFWDFMALQLRHESDNLDIFACGEQNDILGIFENFSLAYWDNDELSALQAADCNIDGFIIRVH